jgi:hypothetical protein
MIVVAANRPRATMHPPSEHTTHVLYSPTKWAIVILPPVATWLGDLFVHDPASAELVASALDVLSDHGPHLGRPLVDTLRGSLVPNMKELRPGSRGRCELRILFVFDPKRRAVLLTAGDKARQWRTWYATQVPIAERRYEAWLSDGAS